MYKNDVPPRRTGLDVAEPEIFTVNRDNRRLWKYETIEDML